MKITISDPVLVYAPEMNEAISHWGVYAIPRMWREPSGELVVRFNGEEDSSDFDNLHRAPNLPKPSAAKRIFSVDSYVIITSGQCTMGAAMKFRVCVPNGKVSPSLTTMMRSANEAKSK